MPTTRADAEAILTSGGKRGKKRSNARKRVRIGL
jgi:hypothetical protein